MTDKCGYFIDDFCISLKKPCDEVRPRDCTAFKELLELTKHADR